MAKENCQRIEVSTRDTLQSEYIGLKETFVSTKFIKYLINFAFMQMGIENINKHIGYMIGYVLNLLSIAPRISEFSELREAGDRSNSPK